MLLDAEQRGDGWLRDITFDVCICGSGPAGITLARKLGAKGWSVGLFESGGLDLKADAQDLAVGRNIGKYALRIGRESDHYYVRQAGA